MKSSKSVVSTPTRQLSEYVANALKKPLPREVEARAKLHLIDTFAAMISGSRLVPGAQAQRYVSKITAKKEAGVMGTRILTSANYAALANGMCGHADETDDTHPPTRSHPGTCMVPAARRALTAQPRWPQRRRDGQTCSIPAPAPAPAACARTPPSATPPW